MEQLPTVKIEDGNGDYTIINESDFDAEKHTLFVEKEPKSKGKPKDKPEETEEK